VPDIFLSYNREDQARAKLFAEAFQTQGFDVWWDVGLKTGEAYDQVTEKALREAKAVVVLWSKRSVESRWVRAEATLADRNKTLVPCMIEPCERPIMFELTQTAELSHWQGDAGDKAWAAFLSDVKRFVAKEAAPSVATPTTLLAAPTVQETLKPGQSGSAPSLAVLPFTNRSHLPEDEVFAEGMVEDVISALTQGVNVRVLGSTSTAHLRKAANTDLSAVGRQLGVRYLLEGNVRRVGANLRVTTQLLEAETGASIWTAKFERPLAELAELQEELVTDIAASLDAKVFNLEIERALKKPSDITAWEAVARATAAWRKYDVASVQRVVEEARRAIAIAPDYALGHAILAAALADAYFGFSADDPAEVQRIRAIAERALALAPDDVSVLGPSGQALCFVGLPKEGVRYTGRAVHKATSIGSVHYNHGIACVMLNRPEEALSHLKTAERLMPGWPVMWSLKAWQSYALWALERWTEADATFDECCSLLPTLRSSPLGLLLGMQMGRNAEARSLSETASQLGWGLSQAERLWRRSLSNSPRLEADIATIRALYAAAEPGA
jgi:TolB-like protein